MAIKRSIGRKISNERAAQVAQQTTAGLDEPDPARERIILLVEDEVLIRMTVADVLREHGYCVIEAASGDEALRLLNSGINCDLVVSDVQMPGGIDGTALVQRLKIDRPHLPVILASGHLAAAHDSEAVAFIAKPYGPSDVVAIAARILD
ncbi:response regulator [Mesorhizobium sp. UC22_110]|jgi:CheY-like chemotaxis protein|uniref:response regulator n=1 Tax=unclassified Mesorhizobium TaxID=325217 RepID=UPI00366D320F